MLTMIPAHLKQVVRLTWKLKACRLISLAVQRYFSQAQDKIKAVRLHLRKLLVEVQQ